MAALFTQVYEVGSVPVDGLLRVRRGDTLSVGFVLSDAGGPIDLTGFTGACQLRPTPDADGAVSLTVTIPTPTSGQVDIYLSAATTATLAPGQWSWDLELTGPAGDVTTVIGGRALISADTTRSL